MAEDKKPSKGSKRYGNGPKITKAEEKGDTVSDAGAPKEAAKEAEKTADGDAVEANMDSDPGPEGTEAAGTEAVPVHSRHASERKEMGARHESELHDMHKRHAKELRAIGKRHAAELEIPETEGEE